MAPELAYVLLAAQAVALCWLYATARRLRGERDRARRRQLGTAVRLHDAQRALAVSEGRNQALVMRLARGQQAREELQEIAAGAATLAQLDALRE